MLHFKNPYSSTCPMARKKRINLILSGGGYKGYAHLGVIKALEEAGYTINRIAGCSAGAIIGAMYASTKDIDSVIDFLTNTDFYRLTDISFSKTGLMKGEKIIEHIRSFIGVRTFEELKIPLVVNATDLDAGEEVIFRKGDLMSAIRASSAYPGVFTPKRIGGRLLMDGGIVNPVPISLLRPTLPTVVSDVMFTTPKPKNYVLPTILKQSIEILQKSLIRNKLRTSPHKYVHIRPDTSKWDIFTLKSDAKIIAKGEEATKKSLNKIARMF